MPYLHFATFYTVMRITRQWLTTSSLWVNGVQMVSCETCQERCEDDWECVIHVVGTSMNHNSLFVIVVQVDGSLSSSGTARTTNFELLFLLLTFNIHLLALV